MIDTFIIEIMDTDEYNLVLTTHYSIILDRGPTSMNSIIQGLSTALEDLNTNKGFWLVNRVAEV